MNKKLITELNRQFELMGVKKVLSEDWRTQYGIKFLNAFRREALVGAELTLYQKLMKESIQDFDLAAKHQIHSLEELENDLKLHVDQGVGRNAGTPKIPASVYNDIAQSILKKTAKDSGYYSRISEMLINLYRQVNAFGSGSDTGKIIDDLIDTAKRASKNPDELVKFNEYVDELVRMGVIDKNIPQLIKNTYLKTVVVPIKKNWTTVFKGLNTYFKKVPGIGRLYKSYWKEVQSMGQLQSLFDQVDSLIRQYEEAIIQGHNTSLFNVQNARLQIASLQEQIAKAEPSAVQQVWNKMKANLPEGSLKEIERENGALSGNNVKEWFEYFEKSTDDVRVTKPNDYVGRLQALLKIFKNPEYAGLSKWERIKSGTGRLLNEYFIGSARTAAERQKLLKGLGFYGKLGYNFGERIMAAVFYYPIMGSVIQTVGDWVENTGVITNDGKGYTIPFTKMKILSDYANLHKETLSGGGARKQGNWDAILNSLIINAQQSNVIPGLGVLSAKKLSAISPAFAEFCDFANKSFSGDYIDRTKFDHTRSVIIKEQRDSLQELRIWKEKFPDLEPQIEQYLDTIKYEPVEATQRILSTQSQDTSKTN